MFLVIDLSEHNLIRLRLVDEKVKYEHDQAGKQRAVLAAIDSFLSEHGLTPRKLYGIFVVTGAGSFTSSRVGAVIANTFAYVQHIPVLGIMASQVDTVVSHITSMLAQKPGHYLLPTYRAEAHIGS